MLLTHTCIPAVGRPLQRLDLSIRHRIPCPIVLTGRAPPALPSGSLLRQVLMSDLGSQKKQTNEAGLGYPCLQVLVAFSLDHTFLKKPRSTRPAGPVKGACALMFLTGPEAQTSVHIHACNHMHIKCDTHPVNHNSPGS